MESSNPALVRLKNSTTVRADVATALLRGAVGLGSRIAPMPTAGWLVDRFTRTNRAVRRTTDLGETLMLASRWELDFQGRAIRGFTMNPEGSHPAAETEGPHVLLVHGWDGGAHQLVPFIAPLVARGFSVSLFDLPGHGASEGERTNLREIADAIRRVAAHTGPLEAIVAHSVGCAGTAIAILEGLDVGRVAFVAPPTSLEGQARAFAGLVGASEEAVEPMLATLRGILGRPIDAGSFLRDIESIRAPLLVVHDRKDRVTSFEGATQIVSHWPNARLVPTEGLGHARILTNLATIAAITSFVVDEAKGGSRSIASAPASH